jgi:Tol biopolymer transport system component
MWKYLAAGAAIAGVALVTAKLLVRTQGEWKDGSPAWSPDGRRIAFYSERDGNAEIYVMNADGTGATRLTRTKADEGYPAWSPDGRTISFDADAGGNFDVYAMDADGRNVHPLTRHPARDVSASWSRDGSRIVFMSDRDGGFDAYEAAPDPAAPATRVTRTGSTWFPVFSPDGATLAFHVGRDVHTVAAGGGDLRRLTTDPANGMYPSWVRLRSQNATYSVLALLGSMRASIAPVQPSFGRLPVSFVHVLPPSIVLKNPRSPIFPQIFPAAAT